MVFGATEKWAKTFADLGDAAPDTSSWYVSQHAFNYAVFSSAIDGFAVTSAGTLTSSPVVDAARAGSAAAASPAAVAAGAAAVPGSAAEHALDTRQAADQEQGCVRDHEERVLPMTLVFSLSVPLGRRRLRRVWRVRKPARSTAPPGVYALRRKLPDAPATSSLLLHRDRIRGFVYEVETGQVREVTETANRS